jgi:flagellar basal-body rod protein FlgF
MDAGIYSTVSGSLAAQARLDAIANNLANSSTPGFKAERFVQEAEQVAAAGATAPAVSTPIASGHLTTDFSQGPLQVSGNPLDVALSGEGFLVIDTERGERLTRRGSLAVDGERYLTTSDGARVQGAGGDIQLPEGPIDIAPDGSVLVRGASVGTLRIVTVADPAALVREAGTIFAPGNQALADAEPGTVRVIQGSVEGANVSPVKALVELIETVRGFEAYMHAAERLDQTTQQAIAQVGRV